MTVKDSAYWFDKLKTDVRARISSIVFRTWDPLTTWLEATGKRAAEISADIVQFWNDRFIDSAAGARLDRLLDDNEGVPRLLAQPATDGTITLTRQTEPAGPQTFNVGTIQVQALQDPNDPTATRPVFSNSAALTIDVGATSWTVAFAAGTGGTAGNLTAGTQLQLITEGSVFDTASVATAFTDGTDDETDDAYRQRGKLVMRSRAKGTGDALQAAALTAGAAFAFVDESFAGGPPVTVYAAAADGTLSAGLAADIVTYLDGDPTASPAIPAARAKGIQVSVVAATPITFDFTLPLVVQAWVTGDTLTTLRTDITAAVTSYVQGLNDPSNDDRVMRINRIKDLVVNFRGRGVVDLDDATFLPAANTTLTSAQMAVMGTITWP